MLMNFQLPDSLQIQAKKRQEFSRDFALGFLGPDKFVKLRECSKANGGTVLLGHHCDKLNLGVVLTREGSTLSFIVHSMKTAHSLRQLRLQIESNYTNYHSIFRVSSDGSTLLFFHESKTDIEIRNFNSLKKRGSFDLVTICRKFNLLEYFNQIRVSVDFEFILHLGKIVLMLWNKLVLVNKNSLNQAEVLYDCSELPIKERLFGLRYNSEQKALFAVGMTSFFLFGFDGAGLSYSRHIACNQFGRAMRLLGWDPKDNFILIAERIMGNRENYHLIDCRAPDPIFISFLKSQPLKGTYYDSKKQRLFYIEVGVDQSKEIRLVDLKDFRVKYALDDQQKEWDLEFDTELYTALPPIHDMYTYFFMKMARGSLFFKPLRGIDEKNLKDAALRL